MNQSVDFIINRCLLITKKVLEIIFENNYLTISLDWVKLSSDTRRDESRKKKQKVYKHAFSKCDETWLKQHLIA